MNREILFKAKHIHAMQNNKHLDGIWVQGYLSDQDYINSTELEGELFVDKNTICQYTGFDDIKKVKAFENDIVFCENIGTRGKIIFTDGRYEIEWEDGNDGLRTDIAFWFRQRKMHVIGNVFDDKEEMEDEYNA